ncbi:MAG: molybdopterin cofactor-binding domain-containing protein, partial [Parahaliea sp.]
MNKPCELLDPNAIALSRRQFLVGATLAGGCLLVGRLAAAEGAVEGAVEVDTGESPFTVFGPFLRFTPGGEVIVVSKHSEMGQGAQSGLAAIIAEELDADWSRVRVAMAPADAKRFGHTQLGIQITGGSTSISNSWDQMRRVGASARALFVNAAASQWRVPVGEITVCDSVVTHAFSGRSAGFGALFEAAARQTPPAEPRLKSPDQYRLLGTERVSRLDALANVTGRQEYTADVQTPGLLVAVVAHSPRFGGRVAGFQGEAQARKVPGVVDVFAISSGVAVVAETTYAALQGRKVLTVNWDDSAAEMRSSEEILQEHRDIAADALPAHWVEFERFGEAPAVAEAGFEDYRFDFPYLQHATMEPMNCVATVDGKRVRLQYGAQSQTADQRNVAALIGCAPQEVEIRTLQAGGSFGRRSVARSDYQLECVEIARHIGGGRPVKLQWMREDDMMCGHYRPIAHHRVCARLGADGYPESWDHRIVCAPLLKGTPFASPKAATTAEHQSVEGIKDSCYFRAIANVRAQVAYTDSPVTR